MYLLDTRYLTCAPVHAALLLAGVFALTSGLWSIPATIHYYTLQPCTVNNATQVNRTAAVVDCSGCVDTPAYALPSTPLCSQLNVSSQVCRQGYVCCRTCCDSCCARGVCLSCNCYCCTEAQNQLCTVNYVNATVYVWQGMWGAQPFTTEQAQAPPVLPLTGRCALEPFVWAEADFPAVVWAVPCVVVGLCFGAVAGWAHALARKRALGRRPSIFAMEWTMPRKTKATTLSTAILLIRQGEHSTERDASPSSAQQVLPIAPAAHPLPATPASTVSTAERQAEVP